MSNDILAQQPIKNTQIDGDISVGRNVAMGGDASVQGDTLLKGNTTVEGWLIAANVVSTHKGYFESVEELKFNYQHPQNGWWSFVGETLYVVHKGEWKIASGTFVEGDFEAMKASFISKLKPDGTRFLLKLLGGAEIGDSVDSFLAGKGTILDANGRIQTDRLEVRGSAQFMEVIINRLSSVESDFVFTESGHIEQVIPVADATYVLQLRKRWAFDFPAFAEHDVGYGSVNTLLADGSYRTSWFRVLHTDKAKAQLTVAVYPDNEVPGGKNYPPEVGMNIHRRGNALDENRQTCWYISSREGTIMYLMGVTKPILEEDNYCAWLGLPKHLELFNGLPINYKQPYLFARGAIIQDLLRVDYQGNPVYEVVDVGLWLSTETYIRGHDPQSKRYIQHQVWYGSCCWRCVVPQATVGVAPRWNNTQWICVAGGQNYSLAITSSRGNLFRLGQEYTQLGYILKHGDMNISADAWQVKWERESGMQAEDELWNVEHANAGHVVDITPRDMPTNWAETRKVVFRLTIWLKEGEQPRTREFTFNR